MNNDVAEVDVEEIAAPVAEQLAGAVAAIGGPIGDGTEVVFANAACVVVVTVKPPGWKPPKKRKPRAFAPHPDDCEDDLPAALAGTQRAVKRVYRLIRRVRDTPAGRDRKLLSKELRAEFRKEARERISGDASVPSIHTIGHAITVLKEKGLITKEKLFGWRIARPKSEPVGAEPTSGDENSANEQKAEGDPLPWY